ncbi:MAG: nucleotide exchange factor GrpE [Bacteroidia bacterium]|nr:nucleotide exchange factor GrpE [Bacteroidia bacterium]
MTTQENEEKMNQSEETTEQKQEGLESEETKDKASELEIQLAALNDKYLRLYSEYDNYRKRTAKEKIEYMMTAGEDIYKTLLPVLDDFERAIKSNENITDIESAKEGFNLIYNKLKNNLVQKGLSSLEAMGTEFNADFHEAITKISAPSDDLKGKVVDVIEKGYSLNGKVIRFAKVIVGS